VFNVRRGNILVGDLMNQYKMYKTKNIMNQRKNYKIK